MTTLYAPTGSPHATTGASPRTARGPQRGDPLPSVEARTGVWLVGARGSVATAVILGARALETGLIPEVGCVSATAGFPQAGLPQVADLVFGGHDVVQVSLANKAEQLAAAGVVPAEIVGKLAEALTAADGGIRPGYVPTAARQGVAGQGEVAARLAADIDEFRIRQGLARVVVVNVASTEAPGVPHPAHEDLELLEHMLATDDPVLSASSLYAYAALAAGCPYVDFTPSTGARLPALAALAERNRLPWAGHDGKTGETAVKAALAPMFAARHLRVDSWSGVNLLGGGDGATLAGPAARAVKIASKSRVLTEVLGYAPDGEVAIGYVRELGDFKTAWDLITFTGFLGSRMRMEFTWHGCDSALAAPLVLDLARLTAAAHRRGLHGPLGELGFFFKDPVGAAVHDLPGQYRALLEFARALIDTDDRQGGTAR